MVSNFAKNKDYAIHNTNYWNGIPYIGIGLIDEDILNIKINQKNINLTKEDEERK